MNIRCSIILGKSTSGIMNGNNKRKLDETLNGKTRTAVVYDKLSLNLPLHLIGEDKLKRHVRKRTKKGIIYIYSDEINLLRKIEEAGGNTPALQMTPELLGTVECEEDEVGDGNEDEESVWEDVEEKSTLVMTTEGKLLSRKEITPFVFYYRGDCGKDLKNHDQLERDLICRCSKWHLISEPKFYSLVDRQYTLFQVLKGNQESEEAGLILEGHFYNTFGDLLCNSSFDTVAGEYRITPVGDVDLD